MGLCIGLDLMGGDNPPELLLPAVIEAAKRLSSKQSLIVIATKHVCEELYTLSRSFLSSKLAARISFHECTEVICMSDNPLTAVRRKKNSSIFLGMRLLKEKVIQAFVSCGNTGALIASAAIHLPLLPGISHPSLLAHLPTAKGFVAVLDVGGNILNNAQQLVRLAFLGAAYQKALLDINTPKVGILNIGVESHKGTVEVRQAYDILKHYCNDAEAHGIHPNIHFIGNIEGRDIFKGTVDVLVTDGFTGNVLLKTAEGAATFILDSLQNEILTSKQSKLKHLKQQFNYTEYAGAIVCGIERIIIKVHGNASAESLLASIIRAFECIEKNVLMNIF
jgi:glycerol-3-phosphate acyltransferase PlsX